MFDARQVHTSQCSILYKGWQMVNSILCIVLNHKLFHSVRTNLAAIFNSKTAFQKVLYQRPLITPYVENTCHSRHSRSAFKHSKQGRRVQEIIYSYLFAMMYYFSKGDINFIEFHTIFETDCKSHIAQEKNLI